MTFRMHLPFTSVYLPSKDIIRSFCSNLSPLKCSLDILGKIRSVVLPQPLLIPTTILTTVMHDAFPLHWNLSSKKAGVVCQSGPAAAKSLQSCPTLCNPIDSSPLGSSVNFTLFVPHPNPMVFPVQSLQTVSSSKILIICGP